MQLTWGNWNDICAFAGVGQLSEGKPTGCYIDSDGSPITDNRTSDEIGLLIPTSEGLQVARQGWWLIKADGDLIAMTPEEFRHQPFVPA